MFRTKHTIVLTLSILFSFSSFLQLSAQDVQNMVPNPSFEEKDGTLRRAGQVHKAKSWVPGTGADADLFTTEDDDDEIGAPETYKGRCKPKTGSRFAGIRAFSYRGEEPRSYISARLPEELSEGVLYCVQFHIRLSPLSKFAINKVGAYLSKKDISTTEEKSLIYDAQVMHPKQKIHKNTRLWKPVCSAYQAKGGEEFITIGTFVENGELENEKMRKPRRYDKSQTYDSYYFVDDVSIQAIDNRTECQCTEKEEEDDGPKFVFSAQENVPEDPTPAQQIEGRPVYFAYFTDEIESSFKERLDKIAEVMKENPDLEVKVIGHADQKEAKKIERDMKRDVSLGRAKSVVKYLEEQGVDSERLNLEAVQASDLKAKGESQYLRSKNRRVTFEVEE
jgi:outer membrane protein OmpA-like peptidoglycan-associated protein